MAMQKFTTNSYYNDSEMIFVPSSLGGVIDLDKNCKFESMLRRIMTIPEYWRTTRVQQLGFVEYDIPAARHSRFEHQVGAYDLHRTLIYHSNRNFGKSRARAMTFNITEQAAQAAAFIHDIGHVFPGHPFERAMKKMFPDSYQSHEKWGIEIIERSEIKKTLESYDTGFANKVLDILAEDNLSNNIWQQVHSGNLNVDTMDYLIRDQSRTQQSGSWDKFLVHKIIENIKFDKDDNNRDRIILLPGAEIDYMRMLTVRGEMYNNVYMGGKSAAAEAFLPRLLDEIQKAVEVGKLKSDNPFVKFIKSRGTDYDAYLGLTGDAFNALVDECIRVSELLQLPELLNIAKRYKNVSANFTTIDDIKIKSSTEFYMSEKDAKEGIEHEGGIVKDIEIPLYNMEKPEVFCMLNPTAEPVPFSEAFPEFVDKKIRILKGYFMSKEK